MTLDNGSAPTSQGATWTGLALGSTVRSSGQVEITLEPAIVGAPAADEVVVRVEAAPLNPSDITPMLGGADPAALVLNAAGATARAPLSPGALKGMAGRLDRAIPLGTEGAGLVVAAGASAAAQRLMGRMVAVLGDGLYAHHVRVAASTCVALPEGTTPAQGAAFFVNPLTALGLVETATREGFCALAQTAAASNLGQMIVRLCLKDGIPLVNVVRGARQAALLREIGARYVCDSSLPSFDADLFEAMVQTGATAAFDAVGGGDLASRLLATMEKVAVSRMKTYARYGSTVRKHVYMYGVLDRGPTELRRAYGSRWSVGSWLLPPYLEEIGPAAADALRARVAAELTTTFASRYTRTLALAEAIRPEVIQAFSRRSTGEKFLVAPWRAAR